jgi:hypothetical protein
MAWEAGQGFRASRHATYAFADDKWHAVNG